MSASAKVKERCICCETTTGVRRDYLEPNGEPLCQGCAQDWDASDRICKKLDAAKVIAFTAKDVGLEG